MSYQDTHLLFYLSAEMQSVYSTDQADWAVKVLSLKFILLAEIVWL